MTTLLANQACNPEFTDCVREWTECTEDCPSEEQEQAAIDRARQEWQTCIQQCPPLPGLEATREQLEAAARCHHACQTAYDRAVAEATECNETCDERFTDCASDIITCWQTPDASRLVEVNVSDWSSHGTKQLTDPQQNVTICNTHFAPGTDSGEEVRKALSEINRVEESALDFLDVIGSHQTKSSIFVDPATHNTVDYVDNANDSFAHACHPTNPTQCFDSDDINGFAINTCRFGDSSQDWRGRGDTEFFAITANANCYSHFSNPASSDHPNAHGMLHEFGHATGMNHTNSWPTADRGYISTMQGNLDYPSAYDVQYWRHHYHQNSPFALLNFVASSKIRIDFGGPNQVSGKFDTVNPTRVFLQGDDLFDCDTNQPAEFFTAWFNTGNRDQPLDQCVLNQLRIEDRASPTEVLLEEWHIEPMPEESQDHWVGPADVTAADFSRLTFGIEHDLVFETNVYGQHGERSDDNETRGSIVVFPNAAGCGGLGAGAVRAPSQPPSPVIQLSNGDWSVERAFLTELAASPRMLREVAFAPSRQSPGFRLYRVEKGGLAELLGAQEDDVVQAIDGQPITGPGTLFGGVQRLLNQGVLTIGFTRGTTSRVQTYHVH